jgi:hypothetical protein
MRYEERNFDGLGKRKVAVYDMPSINQGYYWVSVTNVPCPSCKNGVICWAEGGYVPGYRICDQCGKHYMAVGDAEHPALARAHDRLGGWLAKTLKKQRKNLDSKLREYAARYTREDGRLVLEMQDPNDNSRSIYQYRRANDLRYIERRRISEDRSLFTDGSPWELVEISQLRAMRGDFHPILDPLGA